MGTNDVYHNHLPQYRGGTNARLMSANNPLDQAYHDHQGYPCQYDDTHADMEYYNTHHASSTFPNEDIYAPEPMQLDSFDEQVLRMPDLDSRQGQAALGRARLSLPLRSTLTSDFALPNEVPVEQVHDDRRQPQSMSHAYATTKPRYTSSSSGTPLPSSPAFSASQRQRSSLTTPQRQTAARDQSQPHQSLPRSSTSQSQTHTETTLSRPQSNLAANGRPLVRGVELISTHELPDRFRTIFPFPLFNAMQSKCFRDIYGTNDNFVLSSPTGSGKTAVFELAICRLVNAWSTGDYKVVYMAPTKSLCSERKRDWVQKFSSLNLTVEEMTGDSDLNSLRAVQHADIIVTTPEKWDSMTRKWKDHARLVQLIKLFLIDEVHILNKDRGATLEAVVSRMKSVGSDIRFVALSATIPNVQDIATWLGRDSSNQELPAVRECFGEEYRPVKLQKYVCGFEAKGNDFAFDSALNQRLPDIIKKYACGKPILVFCFTRASCAQTAETLVDLWDSQTRNNKPWSSPTKTIKVQHEKSQQLIPSGVAIHHGGMSAEDRRIIERAYLEGQINVICCTSTLAVGVNLPCHTVIIKGTVAFEDGGRRLQELSDLEIFQMIGRAGRPQFDDSAVAVIMTKMGKTDHFKKLVTGQEYLESKLHLNLIEHLNAEIGLGTITSPASARRWLSSTFLRVRLTDNPDHYRLEGDPAGRNLDQRLDSICSRNIELLFNHDLVNNTPTLSATEYGSVMARYYVSFETMKVLMGLPPKPKISEILSSLCQASEFHDMRIRAGEKQVYKEINKSPSLRYPIKVNLALPAHKASLILQSVLGGVDTSVHDQNRLQFSIDQNMIFQHARRLIRCVVDCQSCMGDAVGIRNSLMLVRSLGARVWDDSPLHLQQLNGIGAAGVKKLINADIRSVYDLEEADTTRLQMIMSRNSPFCVNLIKQARDFPRLRVDLQAAGQPYVRQGQFVGLKVRVESGFVNDKVPTKFNHNGIHVCLLAETSDGRKLHFGRISAQRLGKAQSITFEARLTTPDQTIACYVACEEIAGTLQQASLSPQIAPSAFTAIPEPAAKNSAQRTSSNSVVKQTAPNTSKLRAPLIGLPRPVSRNSRDDFADDGIEDDDLFEIDTQHLDFRDIDDLDSHEHMQASGSASTSKVQKRKQSSTGTTNEWNPRRLENGNWECNHPCKNRTACKHACCKVGTENKPKPPKPKSQQANSKDTDPQPSGKTQTTLKLQLAQGKSLAMRARTQFEEVDLSHQAITTPAALTKPSKGHKKDLAQSRLSRRRSDGPDNHRSSIGGKADYSYANATEPVLSFLPSNLDMTQSMIEDFDAGFDALDWDMLDQSQDHIPNMTNEEEEEMLEAALIGAEDSQVLASCTVGPEDEMLLEGEEPASPPHSQKNVVRSLFVTDSSTPDRPRDQYMASSAPLKRRVAEVGDEAEPLQCRDAPNKRARTTSYYDKTKDDTENWPDLYQPEDELLFGAVDVPTEVVATLQDSPRTAELKAWMHSEFGDTVELI